MNEIGDFSRYTKIIPQEHIPALKRSLGKIPDFSWLLSVPHPTENRLQGDLIKDLPTVFLDQLGQPRTAKFTVMVLNNSCDLPDGRVDFVTAAPVVDFNGYLELESKRRDHASLENYANALRRNQKTELFYLPSFHGFPNGALVLLHLVCSVSASLYQRALNEGSRVASFSQAGFYFLLIKLTNHLARAESHEVSRT
jgi:hypothetical protein